MDPDRFVIDSNIFVAVYCEGDSSHRDALDILSELNQKTLIVHPYVIQETATVLAYKLGQYAAVQFLKDLENAANIIISGVDIKADIKSFSAIRKKISFTDAVLVALAKSMNAGLVTFDRQMLSMSK
jgi:predicted nucleic acid-binding protein